jgi:superfamily II DNA or RNA helicase
MEDRAAVIVAATAAKELTDARHAVAAQYLVSYAAAALYAVMQRLKLDLTLHPKVYDAKPAKGKRARAAPADPSFEVFHVDGDVVRVPRYYGFARFGIPTGAQDRRSLGLPLAAAARFTGVLLDTPVPQNAIVNSVVSVLECPLGGGMLQVGCGQGKTVCALAVIARLGRKAAVLVNNGKTLEPQWIRRVQEFMPGARVGVVRQKKCDIAACDIVVCSIQSLMRRDYPQALMDQIGTVVVDEAHHIGARMFSQAMRQFSARHTLGLSATPDRKDGLRKYVEWMLGPVVVRRPTDFSRVVVLRYVWADSKVEAHASTCGPQQRALMIKDALADYARSVVALRVVRSVIAASAHRCVLVLSERVAQVEEFAAWCTRALPGVATAMMHGKVSEQQLRAADESARIVVATYGMANEALDISRLDTLVALTPMVGFIEQIVGRVVRIHPTKRVPLVVDLVDNVGLFAGMARKRATWYDGQRVRAVHRAELCAATMESDAFDTRLSPAALLGRVLDEPDLKPLSQERVVQ